MTIKLSEVKCPRCGHFKHVSKTWFKPVKLFGWQIMRGFFLSHCTECGNQWKWYPGDEEVIA